MNPRVFFFGALLIALSSNFVFAQDIKWNSALTTGFVFQITNNEAQKLLTKSLPDTIINSLLHTEIDTFNVEKGWSNRPHKGHFILARIIENKLHCEYTSIFPYQVLLLKEYNTLSLQVLDLEGNVREDAKVRFKTRRIRFDPESKTYRLENDWFNASSKIVTVELDDFRSVFNIEKHEVPTWSNDYSFDDDGPAFYSYMITDKNKYKPGERVRFKSFALSGSRSPIRRDLEVRLMKDGRALKIGTVSPHRPGSFASEIHLHDSLDLILDRYYTLQLWDKSGRVVANCTFKYEDYELHGNKLHVTLETERHFQPASNYVKIRAINENGLMLKDARAFVTILTENIREIFQPLVVLPDTLMYKEILLDADSETVVEIPSPLFQKSNTTYYVHVSVLNSQNQRMESGLRASHYFSQYEITATYSGDSIVFGLLDNGVPRDGVAAKIFRDGGTEGVEIILPHKEKINAATTTIRIERGTITRSFTMADMLPKIEFTGGIEKDSFNIAIKNPQQVPVSWYVYQGSMLIEKGFGTEVDFKSRIENRSETYYAELLYSFGGFDHVLTRQFEFREGALDIALHVPERVYPGQKVDATIEVTDDEGNAVGGVDLTALAAAAKLNYYLPDLPYYGSKSYPRSQQATYSKNEVNKHTAILDLDYRRWAKRARLDTMRYYRFTYPGKNIFFHKTPIRDSTQFAVYVMKDGTAKEPYVIEVNRTPIYYSWTGQPKAYSFYVEPAKKKSITLRLHDRVLILDSMAFDRGKKTIFSLDIEHLPEGVDIYNIAPQIVRMGRRRKATKWVFTTTEIQRHNVYLASFTGSDRPAYLIAGKEFVPVTLGQDVGRKTVVGPVSPGMQTYIEHERLKTTYRHAGGFAYSFADNIVYKTDPPRLIPDLLADVSFQPMASINDLAINKNSFLESKAFPAEIWHPRVIDFADYASRLKLLLPYEEAQSGMASVFFQECETGNIMSPCRKYISNAAHYYTLPRGCHHAIVMYNNGTYLKMDSIPLRERSNVVADMKYANLHASDSLSNAWRAMVGTNCFPYITAPPRTFTLKQSRRHSGNVHGSIYDDVNMPLPGATVVVKGTTIGAAADINGRFFLDIPEDPSTLVVSFIGYMTKEIEVRPGSEISVVMEPDITQLQEVVVSGYGVQTRQNLSASVLSGRVAGVTLSEPSSNENLETDESVTESGPDAEQRLYEELLTLQTIRSRFSDVGFWEPRLFTDRHGKSNFTVTFPDDLTRWDAVVYGMNRQLQTGTARKSIRSYKPLMAELHTTQFLTVGDTAYFLGKVLNYSSDKTILGKTQWNGASSTAEAITFDGYHTEIYPVVVASSDTVTTRYSFMRDDGYFDGEERKVPVVEQGTYRANGTISVLKNNDSIHVQAKNGEVVTVELLDNSLDLYAGEVRSLLRYRYDCNEQLASKLIGFVNQKLIAAYKGERFRYDRDVNRIIQRLLKNQNSEFLWSWWDVSPNTSYWMSAHILRALKAAKDAGYTVNLDIDNLARKATYKYEFLNRVTLYDVELLHALAMWDAKLDYAHHVKLLDRQVQRHDSINRARKKVHLSVNESLMHEKLLLLEVRQLQNLPFVSDSLLHYKKETILNEVYFSDSRPARYWYWSDLMSNAVAYRIVKRDSTLSSLTTAMQMYFLAQRRKGTWNTYETSNVLLSILPHIIAQGSSQKASATVSLQGKINENLKTFPFRIQLKEAEAVSMRKESGMPLYFMQYTEERVTRAQASTNGFTINTAFDQKSLKAGEPAVLKATVKINDDAKLEHVMIEIPIPAGCSYADKRQFYNRIETHREHFKEKTVVFCENMTPGTYVFQVQLLPRFTGTYHVNPAQVSLMYFPVVNANTHMETVKIREH